MMFKQDYRNANDGIHAGDALLIRIRAEEKKTRPSVRAAWWATGGTVAAAAIVLIALISGQTTKDSSFAAPRTAEAVVDNGANDMMIAGEVTAYESDELMLDIAEEEVFAEEEADAEAASLEIPLTASGIAVSYEDIDLSCAMDDWFVSIRNGDSLLAAEQSNGMWLTAGTFCLDAPAHTVLTDDDLVVLISDDGADSLALVYTLSTNGTTSFVPVSRISQAGSYVDAIMENDVLYLLTADAEGLHVGAADCKMPEDFRILHTLSHPFDDARLFETNDGVLVACNYGNDCILTVLYNEPDGFAVDAEGMISGTLLYAYRTRDATWHTVVSVGDVIAEKILDDFFSLLSEQELTLSADTIYFDDEELLACSYPYADNVLHIERSTVSGSPYYGATGEVWESDGVDRLGEIVSWDDDSYTVYTFDGKRLYAMDVPTGAVETAVTFSN